MNEVVRPEPGRQQSLPSIGQRLIRPTASGRVSGSIAALAYAALLATILANAWFAGTPLPLGGPNVVLGVAAVLLALSLALCDFLAGKRLVVTKNLIPLTVVSSLLAGWAAIVHLFNDTGLWLTVGKMALGIGILFAVYLTVTGAGKAWFMIAAGVVAAFVSALFGLATIYIGEPFWSLWFVLANPSPLQTTPVLWGRAAGLSSSTANFAYLMVIAIPSALAMLLYNPLRGRGARLAWDSVLLLLLAVLVVALLANATRSAILGVVCGSFLVVVFPGARGQIVRRLHAVVLPAAVVAALSSIAINLAEPLHTVSPILDPKEAPSTVAVAMPARVGYHPEPPGEFTLGVAPSDCSHSLGPLSGERSIPGAWSNDCPTSLQQEGSYARHYSFTLEDDGPVTIDLDSTEEANAYLHLFAATETGDAALVALNDNGARYVGLGQRDARITKRDLPAGTYIIEATTYLPETPGEFTLRVAPKVCFHFLGTLFGSIKTISGAWSGDCPTSLHREGSYARHYSFTLEEDGPLTIDLDAAEEVDAYLYLFSGTQTDAAALAMARDDKATRITRDRLPAGTYTIESTTASPGTRGEFELRIHLPHDPVDSRSIFSVSDESARTRLPMAVTAIRYALDHPLGTGEYSPDSSHISPGTDSKIAPLVLTRSPHNQFLEVLVNYGFPGLALLVSFYVFALRSLIHSSRLAIRYRDTDALFLIAAGAGGVTAYLINSLFQPHGPFVDDWHHFFLIGLLFGIQRICHEKSELAPPTNLLTGAAE